jgi:hypothetical protein
MQYCSHVLVPALLVAASPALAATQIYSYEDDSGTVTFTTELGSIPEKYRNRVAPLDSDVSSSAGIGMAIDASTSVRVVTASGEYRMGDHDTRADAVRLAIEAAKRQALEQVATYLESVTEVKNMDVTRDDIRTYTAGIVMVLNQNVSTRLEGETVVIHADLTAQIDPHEVVQAITALRENESAKQELETLRVETDQLHQQLDAANQALAMASSPDQVQALSQQRQDLLNQMQTNALVSQAWTDWVYVPPIVYPYPWIGVQEVHGLLLQARNLNPQNAHLRVLQQVVTAQVGATPSAAPLSTPSPLPPRRSLLMPSPVQQFTSPSHLNQSRGASVPAPTVQEVSPPTASASQRFSTPLPPTLQQVHPPHLAQPSPPVLHAPYAAPSPQSVNPQYFGGRGGYSGRGGSGGGGHHGR